MRHSTKRLGVALLLSAAGVLGGCGGADAPESTNGAMATEQAAAQSAEKSAALQRALALARKTNDARVKSERLRRGEPAP